jgi:hypothetical protein
LFDFFAPVIRVGCPNLLLLALGVTLFRERIAVPSSIGCARLSPDIAQGRRRSGERNPGGAATHDDTAATIRRFATGFEVLALPRLLPRARSVNR